MKTQPLELQLAKIIEKFCKDTGITYYRFGVDAVANPRMYGKLKDGKEVTSTTINKIREYIYKKSGKLYNLDKLN